MYPPLSKFAEVMVEESDLACDVSTAPRPMGENRPKRVEKGPQAERLEKRSAGTFSTEASESSGNGKYCHKCEVKGHILDKCRKFLKWSMDQRKAFIREKELCFACLDKGHRSAACRNRAVCDVCGRRHPTFLHGDVQIGLISRPKLLPRATVRTPRLNKLLLRRLLVRVVLRTSHMS